MEIAFIGVLFNELPSLLVDKNAFARRKNEW